MKRKQILAAVVGAVVFVSLSGCGTSDKVASITVTDGSTSLANLKGIGNTLQLKVTANYTSGKQVDETNWSTFQVIPDPMHKVDDTGAALLSPPQTITISPTGMLTSVEPAVCTWQNLGTPTKPSWFLTGDYQVIATYKGIQSQPIFIGIASAAANTGDGTCGP